MLPIILYIFKNVSYRNYRNMLIEQHEAETRKVTWKSEVLNKELCFFLKIFFIEEDIHVY